MQFWTNKKSKASGAFTLIEVLVCTAVIGVVFVSLYAGMASGVSTMQMARHNLRATQILVEKMETIRLYNWDQITTNFIPTTFSTTYYPSGTTNQQGVVYTGKVIISKPDLNANYDDDMRLIEVELNWTTGSLPRTRSVSTLYSRYGLQNYVY